MAVIYLVTGGARSGKSAFSESLAKDLGADKVLYIATLSESDSEMIKRIARHRRLRPAAWRTLEIITEIDFETISEKVILLDCLSGFVSNILIAHEEIEDEELIGLVLRKVAALTTSARKHKKTLIVVTNEVGSGIVPAYKLGRVFRDALGLANQYVAKQADNVASMTVGIATVLKGEFPD